jgi:hypothetical protein
MAYVCPYLIITRIIIVPCASENGKGTLRAATSDLDRRLCCCDKTVDRPFRTSKSENMDSDIQPAYGDVTAFNPDPDHHAVAGQDTETAKPDYEYYFELVVFKVVI